MARNYTRKFYVPIKLIGKSQVVGTPTVTVLEYDASGKVLLATGATVPTDADAGYAKGCLFIKTDGSAGSVLYLNEGSNTSADFNVVESAASTVTGVTGDEGLLGGGTEGSVTVSRGLAARNNTGGTLTKGTLVRVSGYASSKPLVVKADADTAGAGATHVLAADLTTATNGDVYGVQLVTGIDTSAVSAAGDPLYLSATAGEFTATAPTGADQVVQRVGIVTVKDATVGEALFFPEFLAFEKVGTSGLQDDAVSTAKLAADAVTGAEIADDAIDSEHIAAGAVDNEHLAADIVTGYEIADDAVSLEHLDAGITPTQLVIASGIFTTAGGDANESITGLTGVVGTDTAIVWVQKAGVTPRTVDTITPGTDSVAVVMSDDPSTDHKLGYIVLRTAS